MKSENERGYKKMTKDNIMQYDYEKVAEAYNLVKDFDFTIATKAEHFEKCYEVERLLDAMEDLTECMLFRASWTPWDRYATMVNNCFMHKVKCSKKQLDDTLKDVANYIKREISDLYRGCLSGIYEVKN